MDNKIYEINGKEVLKVEEYSTFNAYYMMAEHIKALGLKPLGIFDGKMYVLYYEFGGN